MARDASSSGDHVSAENYLQHAEHYFRLMNGNGGGSSAGQRSRSQGRPPGNGANAGSDPTARAGLGGDAVPPEVKPGAAEPGAAPAGSSPESETDSADTTPVSD